MRILVATDSYNERESDDGSQDTCYHTQKRPKINNLVSMETT